MGKDRRGAHAQRKKEYHVAFLRRHLFVSRSTGVSGLSGPVSRNVHYPLRIDGHCCDINVVYASILRIQMVEIHDHNLSGRAADAEVPATPVATDNTSVLPASSAIESVDLFAEDCIGVTSDLSEVVKT